MELLYTVTKTDDLIEYTLDKTLGTWIQREKEKERV
jgi:hypothetical protein